MGREQLITKCISPTGSALLLGTQNQGTSQTPENCKVTILNSEIFNCSSDGGGIFINGYNGGKINGGTLNLILNDKLRVTDNSSRYGGGISFNFGQMSFTQPTTYNAIIDGCIISNNTASDQGGAICFMNRTADYTQKTQINIGIRMESGTFENNTAVNRGGALYVDNTNISYTSPQAADAMVLMKGNEVTGQSGEGGGLYLTNGTVTAGKMTLEDNSASKGGAMFVLGTLTIEGSSKVAGNVAGDCAGGYSFVLG